MGSQKTPSSSHAHWHHYVHSSYLARNGEPESPADLSKHECLSMLKSGAGSWTLGRDGEMQTVSVGGRFSLNSVGMIRRLATPDMGIILMSEAIVTDDVASEKLCRILPNWYGTPLPVYAIAETRLIPAKTQRFIEFLRERLGYS